MSEDARALLAHLRRELEVAGLPVESLSVMDDDVRLTPRVIHPRVPYTTPLLDEGRDDAA